MNCHECIYFKKTDPEIKYDRCTKHMTVTMPDWRCAVGLKQDNRTPQEVEDSIAKSLQRVQDNPAWTPNFGPEEGKPGIDELITQEELLEMIEVDE